MSEVLKVEEADLTFADGGAEELVARYRDALNGYSFFGAFIQPVKHAEDFVRMDSDAAYKSVFTAGDNRVFVNFCLSLTNTALQSCLSRADVP